MEGQRRRARLRAVEREVMQFQSALEAARELPDVIAMKCDKKRMELLEAAAQQEAMLDMPKRAKDVQPLNATQLAQPTRSRTSRGTKEKARRRRSVEESVGPIMGHDGNGHRRKIISNSPLRSPDRSPLQIRSPRAMSVSRSRSRRKDSTQHKATKERELQREIEKDLENEREKEKEREHERKRELERERERELENEKERERLRRVKPKEPDRDRKKRSRSRSRHTKARRSRSRSAGRSGRRDERRHRKDRSSRSRDRKGWRSWSRARARKKH